MSRYHTSKNNFNFGEFSPKSIGRSDLEEYGEATEVMSNWLPGNTGGAFRRPGTLLVKDLEVEMEDEVSNPVRPYPRNLFLTNYRGQDGENYVIVLNPFAINNANASGTNIAIVRAFRVSKLSGANPFGDEVTVEQTTLSSELDALSAPQSEDLVYDATGFVAVQSGDVIFVTHSSGRIPPFNIVRVGSPFGLSTFSAAVFEASGNFVPASFINNVLKRPFEDPNITSTTITPSGTSGTVTLTASTGIFTPQDVRRTIRLIQGAAEGAAIITVYTSPTEVTATVFFSLPFGATTATTNWARSAWGGINGYPRTLEVFEQSLYYASSPGDPDTIWKSLTGNPFHLMQRKFIQDATTDASGLNYFGPLANTDAANFVLGNTPINWMTSTNVLNVGTETTELIGSGGDTILGPLSVGFRIQTRHGSERITPVRVGYDTVFANIGARKLRNFRFNETNGSNLSQDISVFAEHMSKEGGNLTGFMALAFSGSEDTIYAVNKNGLLTTCLYRNDSTSIAWCKHPMGGFIQSVTTAPTDDLIEGAFFVVKRGDLFLLEYLPRPFDGESLSAEAGQNSEEYPIFVDSAVIQHPTGPISAFSGLSHLEGEEVWLTKNGQFLGAFTVDSGEIPVEADDGDLLVAGVPQISRLILLPLNAGGEFGSAIGTIRRNDTVVFRLHKTLYLRVKGKESGFSDTIVKNDLFTGVQPKNLSADPSREMQVEVVCDLPLPCNILFITQRGFSNDG